MKIFIFTAAFFPSVGGMETIIDTMVREFLAMGHDVRLGTTRSLDPDSPADYDARFPYPVLRTPSNGELLRQVKWCDVYYQNDAFLKKAWPLLLARRPLVIEYMLWRFGPPGQPLTFKNRVLAWILSRVAWHMGQSHALVRYLPVPSTYVPTPFRSGLLRVIPEVKRDRDVVFAGRVIREKGVGVLLDALALLKSRGRTYAATIVGKGNHLEEFQAKVRELGLEHTVAFSGVLLGEEFARTLNRHEVICVPSVWDEPFGTVAAEGIACGCVAVASDSAGLPDTVGPCGLVVPRGDAAKLADALEKLLEDRANLGQYRENAQAHLAQFTKEVSAESRLAVFRKALAS